MFILSIYMVIDRDSILAFLFRLVPPSYADEARLLQTSVARSFGGFLRGQAVMGAVYFLIALATSLLLGLPLEALTSSAAGLLMAIPFFGPFLAWAPPVIAAHHLQARGRAAGDRAHGHRLVHRHERAPAADHAGSGRDPPDRGARVGAHRLAHRRASPARSSGSRSRPSRPRSSSTSSIASSGDRSVTGRAAKRAQRPRGSARARAARADARSGGGRRRTVSDDDDRPAGTGPRTAPSRATRRSRT